MSDYVPPCADPANNADDWFIEKDGKQYPDDDLLEGRRDDIYNAAYDDALPDGDDPEAAAEAAVEVAEAEALKAALTRRRHAKDACYRDCYVRASCLAVALGDGPTQLLDITFGTRGGYYPDELREIDKERQARAARRAARRAAG